MRRSVYMDYSATTPVRPEVIAAMEPYLSDRFGNPSSIHAAGRDAATALEEARREMRAALGAGAGRVIFTGSGSEADNIAVLGFARRYPDGRVICSRIEHKAVLEATKALMKSGYDARLSPVTDAGVIDLDALTELIPDDRATLVSVMWANNETGAVQPVGDLAELCHERGATFHTDAVQALGKLPLDVDAVGPDLVAVSAHKIGGPKGVGALWVRDGVELEPLIHGGGHQWGLRPGTENVAGSVGLARAASMAAAEVGTEAERLAALRDRLEAGLLEAVDGLAVNAAEAPRRTPNVLSVSVPRVDIEGLLTALDLEGLCVSSGSACTTGTVAPSHVITAMGRAGDLAANTVRFSLGWRSEPDDIDYALAIFPRVVERVREFAGSA